MSAVYGPLSHRAPNTLPRHNLGVLAGPRPTPAFFGDPVNSNMYAGMRNEYRRTTGVPESPAKWKTPMDSSMRTAIAKRTSVGQAAFKVGLLDVAPMSTKSADRNLVRDALRGVRNGGSVVPRKVGAVYR